MIMRAHTLTPPPPHTHTLVPYTLLSPPHTLVPYTHSLTLLSLKTHSLPPPPHLFFKPDDDAMT